MVANKTSVFPNVLKEYEPSFESPGTNRNSASRGCRHGSRQEETPTLQTEERQRKPTFHTDKQVTIIEDPTHKKKAKSNRKNVDKSRNKTPTLRAPSRERTSEYLRRQEIERYQQNYQNWQQVKTSLKDEQHETLRNKIIIQQELIHKQDELAQQRLRQKEDEKRKKLEEERAVRAAQSEALQRVCRESLEADKQKHVGRKAVRQRKKEDVKSKHNAKMSQIGKVSEQPSEPPETMNARVATTLSTHSSLASVPILGVAASPENSVLEEADEEIENEGTESEILQPKPSELPWHHQQLYKLYGNEADYFLYPKFDEKEKKTSNKPMNPKLRRYEPGQSGAGELWTSLRNESRMKLEKDDQGTLPELKVPDIARLMDQDRVKGAQDYKHKVELMYRSSNTNEDRSKILLYNNPMPNLNNWEGHEGCGRYMPSWISSRSDEELSELSYKKWIHPKPIKEAPLQLEGSTEGPQGGNTSGQQYIPEATDAHKEDEWDFLRQRKQAMRTQPKPPKVLFLTEKAAMCEGQFSKRRQEILEARHMPQAFNEKMGRNAQSVMAMVGSEGTSLSRCSDLSSALGSPLSRSQSQASQKRVQRSWQPLSLAALIEYKSSTGVAGRGHFSHGSTPVWYPHATTSAH